MFRAVKIKISDQQLIEELEFLHQLFKREYDFVRHKVSLTSFDEKEYSHAHRGRFTEKLAALTNKRYLAWNVNQKAKYFRMFAQQLRQDFCSLKYRYDISVILAKYGFNPSNPAVRDELKALNLYPTAQEIKNICRQGTIVCLPETLSLPLDFSLGQDKQTITQPDKKEAVFFIKFRGKWTRLSFDMPKYFKRKTRQENFECYCKPKFVKDENQDWYVVLAIMLSTDKPSAKNDIYAGIDIGLKYPYTAIAVKDTGKEQVFFQSQPFSCKREMQVVNHKLAVIKEKLSHLYHKIDVYQRIIARNKNPQFTVVIQEKLEVLIQEKNDLRRKRRELNKRLCYLAARDLRKQLKFFNVGTVKLERLNWVENSGGSWAFSQMQQVITEKLQEDGIAVKKVSPAYTSSQNPFTTKKENGVKQSDRNVRFAKYIVDRDVLAAINIALRDFKTVKHLVLTRRQFGVIACRMAESETHTKRENKSNKSYNPFNHGDLLQTC